MTAPRSIRLLTIGACLLLCGVVVAQQPFDLDPSFRTEIGQAYVSSILPLDGGQVLASGLMRFSGELTDKRLVRLNTNGTRDETFNNSGLGQGKLTAWLNDIFYVGTSQTVRRILPTGLQDPGFIEMNLGPYFSSLQGGDYHVFPDGRVLMSGLHLLDDPLRGFVGGYCLCWFSNQGYLDTTRVHRTCSGVLYHIEELPNGQFMGSGSTSTYDGQAAGNIFRFNADGSFDPTFDAHITYGEAFDFVALGDGRVYAAGRFMIQGIADTLSIVRFMPDGSLDPVFDHLLDFRVQEMTTFQGKGLLRKLHLLDENRLVCMGNFELVDGEPRGCVCMVDSLGNLSEEYFAGAGCGNFVYQGEVSGAATGLYAGPDGSYYICGAYHGYDDGTTNDTTQRMVSRLYGLDVGMEERQVELHASLKLHPNPASTWVAFDYDLRSLAKDAKLIVLDATGREVWRASLVVSKTQVLWDVRGVQPGTYAAILENGGARLTTERLVLQQ